MWAKDTATACKNNVGTGVVRLELHTTFQVNYTFNTLSNKIQILRHIDTDLMQNTLANLSDISYVNFAQSFNCHLASVVLLAT
jgi:hypothetical protein